MNLFTVTSLRQPVSIYGILSSREMSRIEYFHCKRRYDTRNQKVLLHDIYDMNGKK